MRSKLTSFRSELLTAVGQKQIPHSLLKSRAGRVRTQTYAALRIPGTLPSTTLPAWSPQLTEPGGSESAEDAKKKQEVDAAIEGALRAIQDDLRAFTQTYGGAQQGAHEVRQLLLPLPDIRFRGRKDGLGWQSQVGSVDAERAKLLL